MVRWLEKPPLQEFEVREISRGPIDNGARAQSHKGSDQDLRLLFLKLVLNVSRIRVAERPLVLLVFLLVPDRLEQLPQIQLRESLDGDAKG